jgi:hypothetical protein
MSDWVRELRSSLEPLKHENIKQSIMENGANAKKRPERAEEAAGMAVPWWTNIRFAGLWRPIRNRGYEERGIPVTLRHSVGVTR